MKEELIHFELFFVWPVSLLGLGKKLDSIAQGFNSCAHAKA